MRCSWQALMAGLLIAGAAIAQEAPLDRILRAYHQPLADGRLGSLYEPTLRLLNAVRQMPQAIDLGTPVIRSASARASEGPQPPVWSQGPTGKAPQAARLLQRPVVSEEELAYTQFLAGRYEEAAATYRRLRQQSPEDAHLLLMLALSERNCGNVAEARQLLSELQKRQEARPWAEWLAAMIGLNESLLRTGP